MQETKLELERGAAKRSKTITKTNTNTMITEEQIKNLKPGDIVREVSWNGIEPKGLGNIYEVEANDGTVIMLKNNPCNIALAPCFLELVYSAGKENTCTITQEELKDTPDDRFKVIVDNMDSYSHKVKDTNTGLTVAVFPYYVSEFEDELAARVSALKKAIAYCNYLNSTYESK